MAGLTAISRQLTLCQVIVSSLLQRGSSRSATPLTTSTTCSSRCYNAAAHALRLQNVREVTSAPTARCYNAAAHALRLGFDTIRDAAWLLAATTRQLTLCDCSHPIYASSHGISLHSRALRH